MSLWIKICGNTSLKDAQLAAEAGADAVGFVFAPSLRRVTAAQVADLVPHLPTALEKIGVFVDAPFEEIEATARAAALTGVQLHFDAAPELHTRLRARFGPALRILRVVHFDAGTAEQAEAMMQDANVDAVMMDSRTVTAVGGTGQAFDWSAASKSLFQNKDVRSRGRLVVAGGLTPDNVGEAVATLRPWGVDVVSGVEASPGQKDADKVRAFIANARRAVLG
jgi:phosphoribosylanthranilate isomerase